MLLVHGFLSNHGMALALVPTYWLFLFCAINPEHNGLHQPEGKKRKDE